ncbi:hypothetical protein PVAND_014293 [Polypedilum vanderplanki]|uniref:HAUS augmin-like complex subunit 3 N-terminal domain-containing protein n=1 Tax=Polypedilum vanderplanki TaxID=319348 RepID=A0A9J6CT20_POLVA|nr:hypothetical protein PVAND_014293 [Polypedilum vanderplanki]
MDSLENSEILKLLGLNDNNKWILQDEVARKFFEYIANNLDSDNILTDSEIRQYEELKVANLILEDEELQNEIKNIETNFPGFFLVSDEEIKELEQQVKQMENEKNEREERVARMQEYEEEQLKKIAKVEKQNQNILIQQKLYIDDCRKKSKELIKLQKTNLENIAYLNEIYTLPQTTPSLMYHMPLDQYFLKCQQLLGTLEVYMRNNFRIKRRDDILDEEDDEILIRTIHQTKKEILEVERKKFEEELNVAGMHYTIENLEKYNLKVVIDYHEMRSIIDELIFEKENLEIHLPVLQQEAQMLVEQVAVQKIIKHFHQFCQEKYKRVINQIEKCKKVHELTESLVDLSELLWIGMKLDLDRFKNRVENRDDTNLQAQECIKRINKMKQLSHSDAILEIKKHYLEQFQNLLVEYLNLNKDRFLTIDKCINEYISYEENLHAMIQLLKDQKHFLKVDRLLKKIDEQSKIFKKFILNGPTNKPCLYDPKFIVRIFEKKQKRNELDKIFQELRSSFQKNIVDPFNNDKFHRMRILLFIWFCSDQRKVILAIKEVQNRAAEEGSSSFRALNINMK